MKIAILIDWLGARGGGEKTVYYMAKQYDADIYTAYADWDKILPEFRKLRMHTYDKIMHLPLIKQEMTINYFKTLDLSNYDAVVALGYYSIYAAIKNKNIIWYPYGINSIFHKKGRTDNAYRDPIFLVGSKIWKTRIEKSDKNLIAKHVHKIVTISKYARRIIKEYHGKNSEIVNPIVEMDKFRCKPQKGYYLMVARLEAGKRVDLAINAFKQMPKKTLYIEGSGSLDSKLKKLAQGHDNIKFLGRVGTEKLIDLYSNCIALIGTAYYDEWSMPMVEAMASGKPCIAVNQGAYPEIIINNKTGILVAGTPQGIINGVNKVTPKFAFSAKNACIKRARNFDSEQFFLKWDKILKKFTSA